MASRAQRPVEVPSFHEWALLESSVWATFHRADDGYLIRFPGLADFEIASDGGAATCWPVPGLDAPTREHLFLNQVLPLMQSRQKKLVFHASAVETQAGAVAFLAPSGRGKSTLAASFATAGQRFLTDDGLVLEPGEGCYVAQPSHPSLRLWKDSRLTLLSDAAELASPASYTSKARLLASPILPHCAEPRPLAAAFFLGDGSATDILIHELRGSAAVSAWVSHSFLLEIEDPSDLAIHFEKITTVAEVVPSFHLNYKRSYDDLVRLRRTIMHHLSDLGLPA